MFRNPELERLRTHKDLLVLEGDVRRLQLMSDWHRLRSSGLWRAEASGLAKRHPLGTAAVVAAGGFILIQALRRPRVLIGWLSRVGGVSSTLLSAARIFLHRPGKP